MPAWYVLAAVLASNLALSGVGIAYIDRQDGRWCGLVVALDGSYEGIQPETESGQRMAAELANLRAEFDCE